MEWISLSSLDVEGQALNVVWSLDPVWWRLMLGQK